MKNLKSRLISVSLLCMLLIAGFAQKTKAQDVMVSFQTFYDNLSPYGQWVYDPEYGDVWVPNEGGDFRPYGSRGRWVMTEYGNTWMSDDPWGWAVYHYGRWTYNPYYGWIWIPGYEWAPAWVNWRWSNNYCGWAPLGPGMNVGISVGLPTSWWIFVAPTYMYRPNCINYWRGPSYNTTYINNTTIINNYYVDNSTHVRYNYGPRPEVIQRVTNQPVQVFRVNQTNRPGAPVISQGNRTVNLYRPTVNQATVRTARPATIVEAPKAIGRPQAAAPVSSARTPMFRQEVQRGAIQPRPNTQPANPAAIRGGGNRVEPQNLRNEQQQRQPVNNRQQMQQGQQMQQQRNEGQRLQQMQRDQQMQQQRNEQQQRQQQVQRDQQMQQQRNEQQRQQQGQRDQQMQQQRNEQQQRQQQMQRDQQMQQQRNEQQRQQQAQRDQQMQQQRNEQQQRQQQMQREQQQQMQRDQQMQQQRNEQQQRQQQMQREQQQQQQRDQQMQQQRQQQQQMQREQQMQQQRQQQMQQQQQMQREQQMQQQRQQQMQQQQMQQRQQQMQQQQQMQRQQQMQQQQHQQQQEPQRGGEQHGRGR